MNTMKHQIPLTALLLLALLSLALTGCGRDYTAEVREFADGYLSTLFAEHARHRTNITENLKPFYIDDTDKENAEMPEFIDIGPFTDTLVIVKEYAITNIEKIDLTGYDHAYSVKVHFALSDPTDNASPLGVSAGYWAVRHKNRFYIYADPLLNYMLILEKDAKSAEYDKEATARLTEKIYRWLSR